MVGNEDRIKLLKNWYVRIRITQSGHYNDSSKYSRMNTNLGIPVIVFSVIVGTSVFASIQNSDLIIIQLITGLLSVTAAILASLQTFLKFSERSEKHMHAARKLSSLKKEIEQNLVIFSENTENIIQFIDYVRKKWDEINEEYPQVSDTNFIKHFKKYKGEEHFPNIRDE